MTKLKPAKRPSRQGLCRVQAAGHWATTRLPSIFTFDNFGTPWPHHTATIAALQIGFPVLTPADVTDNSFGVTSAGRESLLMATAGPRRRRPLGQDRWQSAWSGGSSRFGIVVLDLARTGPDVAQRHCRAVQTPAHCSAPLPRAADEYIFALQ
jgi:hypothetical protein